MGFLNSTSQVVDAVLTVKGRQLLAQGVNALNITKFALGDDEINYALWNPNHISGSAYYGEAIMQIPVFEASTEESFGLRYKLITLPKDATGMPYISIQPVTVTNLTYQGSVIISPTLLNYSSDNFTAVLLDGRLATLTVETAPITQLHNSAKSAITDLKASYQYSTVITNGKTFKLVGKTFNSAWYGGATSVNTVLYIFDNTTGASGNITVNRNSLIDPPIEQH
jgi:hypothetical protein